MDLRRKFAGYASRPEAGRILFGVSFLEAMCVPLPSDFLLIPLARLNPERGFAYALVAAAGSVCGAIALYAMAFYAALHWGGLPLFLQAFQAYAPVFVLAAGFSGVPFNLISILSGLALVNPAVFIPLIVLTRCLRYLFIAWLVWRSGPKYQEWLERSFNGMTLVITLAVLVISALGIVLFETS